MALEEELDYSNTTTYRHDFFSGANVGVWFGGTLFSEAIGIEYSLVQSKRPIYGWASSLFDAVADGVVQAAGTLYINFRQAHLFKAMIGVSKGSSNIPKEIFYSIPDEQISATYMTNMSETQIDSLENAHWPADVDTSAMDLPTGRPDNHGGGFGIKITYGDYFGSAPNSTARSLRNVHITSFGQTIEIDGKPILEAYNFIARQVT